LCFKSKVELDLMWQLKRAIDPKNLLNPAKVLPVRCEISPFVQAQGSGNTKNVVH
jgi:hypothetical protein